MSATDVPWYKAAIIYQTHVRAFFDANDDGIGDFHGLAEKLDYLQELGVTALWLLPFYPSPLKDDGYDISDYFNIHPIYGSLPDFKNFLREAHRRGLRVITELVLNHTSDQHPWFQRARRAGPGSRYRNYYVWNETPQKYRKARIIFQDFEVSNWSWDPVAKAYYWHRFYHHQPDLNFDSPEVQRAMLQVVEHWLEMGVDGLRLDAVPYLYEREGTNCENLPETHAFLKKLREHVDTRFQGRMLLAEANQWPEDAAEYFGSGDECHAAFHFPLMPRMYMAVHMEDRFPIIDILEQTPSIPESCRWMLFLRNHDELTLEMVTEEERNYMYDIHAREPRARINLGIRRRLAPLMQNNRRQIELLNGLLMSLPGTPILYYGDELGMGDNIYLGDRDGVRTPMQWSADRNAGFSRANPQKLFLPPIIDYEYHYETVNVETQQRSPHSLLSWMKRLIALRHRFAALSSDDLEFLRPANPKVLAFLRRSGDQCVMVVANLSHSAQFVELDLSAFEGARPVELFGQTEFPRIGELPYLLTLTPHAFFWFALRPSGGETFEIREESGPKPLAQLPVLEVPTHWDRVFQGQTRQALERLLPEFVASRPWFDAHQKGLQSVRIADTVPLGRRGTRPRFYLALAEVGYATGESDLFLLSLGFGSEELIQSAEVPDPEAIVARLRVVHGESQEIGVLYDPFGEKEFGDLLLNLIGSRRTFSGQTSRVQGRTLHRYRHMRKPGDKPLEVSSVKHEQSNSTVIFGDRFVLKLYRRVHEGTHPESEIETFLTDVVAFAHTPPLAGVIECHMGQHRSLTVGTLLGYVENEGTAWDQAIGALEQYFQTTGAGLSVDEPPEIMQTTAPALALAEADVPPQVQRAIGPYLESATLLGRRTAELHLALAAPTEDADFQPEPFSRLYQRSIYQAARNRAGRALRLLGRCVAALPDDARAYAESVLARQDTIYQRLRAVTAQPIIGWRTRCHGNYRLDEVLNTGNDFVIVDFEGEPGRPISQRRLKTPPLRDVATMLYSFQCAGHAALADRLGGIVVEPESLTRLQQWTQGWVAWSGAAFLKSYLAVAAGTPLLPEPHQSIQALLDMYLVERLASDLLADLEHHPDRVAVALRALLRLLDRAD